MGTKARGEALRRNRQPENLSSSRAISADRYSFCCAADIACIDALDVGNLRGVESGQEKPVFVLDGSRFADLEGFARELSPVVPEDTWEGNLNAFDDVLSGGYGTPEGRSFCAGSIAISRGLPSATTQQRNGSCR